MAYGGQLPDWCSRLSRLQSQAREAALKGDLGGHGRDCTAAQHAHGRGSQAGQNRFEIRLDPPELGRIDVRLDIDSSGQVTSRLVVERADTLEHLRRDSAGLERALQDAGLKTGDNGLQFSLRDQGFAGRDDNSQSPAAARLLVPDPNLAPVDIPANAYRSMTRAGGVDIRV